MLKAQKIQDSSIYSRIDTIKKNIEASQYEEAERQCKKIFSLKTSVPDEIAFYYGYILYKQNKLNSAKQWLEKYLSFKVKNSYLAALSVQTLDSIACKTLGYIEYVDSCSYCKTNPSFYDCPACDATGNEICPACQGKGVTRSASYHNLGQSAYNTCKKCNGSKIINCSSCNGMKKKKTICPICYDKKRITLKKNCPK
ncbi:MAG: hypothetical protein NZ529_10615 [Cytophagaceae bacterium]|nr:hypothetical protein [Cytophagaceae bacterium]MDW8457239.1 hypothetical protein [Cytophagaceae bacterium]